jgi:hypothetical protein
MLTMSPTRSDGVMEVAGSKVRLVKPGQPRDFPPMPQLPDADAFTVDGDRLVRRARNLHDLGGPMVIMISMTFAIDMEAE